MADAEKVTSESIEEVCAKFGFPYELRDGKHFATIRNVEVVVKFRPDGTLPPGTHAFMTAARKESEEFKRAYPTTSRKTSASGNQSDGNVDDRPCLGKRLFRKYSIKELSKARDLIGGIISEKEEAEMVSKKIGEYELELENIEELASQIEGNGFSSHKQITDRISEIQTELDILKKK